MDHDFFIEPGRLTKLTHEQEALVTGLGLDPIGLCRLAQGLLTLPETADGSELSPERLVERNLRPAASILERAIQLGGSNLARARSRAERVVGTCRHFGVLATAFLRASGIPARARCGFASYFQPKKVDHWVAEYWTGTQLRWVRIDPEILDLGILQNPADLEPGRFLTGGEAWELVRRGQADANDFGVDGTGNWGPGEIRGNVLRDLAALAKVEMLPWDEWGPMHDSYQGRTGAAFDRRVDAIAAACRADDRTALLRLYQEFAVPDEMLSIVESR